VLAASLLHLSGFAYLYAWASTCSHGDRLVLPSRRRRRDRFSMVSFVKLHDPPFGVIWLSWSFL
jgi:hypothetical protein